MALQTRWTFPVHRRLSNEKTDSQRVTHYIGYSKSQSPEHGHAHVKELTKIVNLYFILTNLIEASAKARDEPWDGPWDRDGTL